jgi:DnaJ-class molecular chaperone
MAQQLELYELCPQCKGTGIFQSAHGEGSSSMTCNWPGCNGSGYIYYAKFTADPGIDDVIDKCNDIVDKCNDILDKLNE